MPTTSENVPSNILVQRNLKLACASSLLKETLHSWLSKMHPIKVLMRLRDYSPMVRFVELWFINLHKSYTFDCIQVQGTINRNNVSALIITNIYYENPKLSLSAQCENESWGNWIKSLLYTDTQHTDTTTKFVIMIASICFNLIVFS